MKSSISSGIPKTPDENPDGWKSPINWKERYAKNLIFDFEDEFVEVFATICSIDTSPS